MRISTMTSDYDRYGLSIPERLDRLHDAGFRYVDINLGTVLPDDPLLVSSSWRDNAKRLRDYAENKGMRFVQSHAPCIWNPFKEHVDELIVATNRCIQVCEELGIPNTVVHSGWVSGISQEEFYQKSKEFYSHFFDAMETCGVNVLIENSTHSNLGERAHFYTGEEMRYFLDTVNHPLLHACWDTGHANVEGGQYEDILALGSHLYALHISDNNGKGDEHTIPYIGTMNLDELMCGLIDVGFDGYFDFEATPLKITPNPFERESKLVRPTIEMQDAMERFMYQIGEHCLRSYGCFEE